ncbi:MAG: protein-disulfide reductase DsbD family protein [Verrucomicrobiota bacterium]|nr:protein-disulfide reductase DsbD family protein [Verrucomicrobiota bacterium]
MRRLFFILLMLSAGIVSAQDFNFGAKTKVSLLVNPSVAKAGSPVEVGMRLEMPAGWHTYWRNAGENGTPTNIKWTLPKGITAGEIQWPVSEKVEWLEMFTYAYHGEVLLIVPLTLAADLAPGEYALAAEVNWLECEETCIPGDARVSAKLVVGAEAKPGPHAGKFAEARAQWPAKNELPKLPAQWAGAANADGERTLKLTVPVDSKETEVHFLPFGTSGKKWEIAHATQLTKGENEFTLSKTITSKDGDWPIEVHGVVRFETEGKVTSHETAFQIGAIEPEENPFGFLGDAKCQVSARLDHTQATAGGEVLAGVSFSIPKHWHIFWKEPGAPGEPPKFEWTLPAGITAGEIKWPLHSQLEMFGETANVYENQVMLLVPLAVAKDAKHGDYEIGLKVSWQECDDQTCVPQEKTLQLTLKIGEEAQRVGHHLEFQAWLAKVPSESGGPGGGSFEGDAPKSIWYILSFAFLGGLILNVMPCVLPVISLKILGFVQQSNEAPGRLRNLGLTYGLGVFFSFMVLAGVMVGAKQATGMASWGMQMQSPIFNLVLMLVVTLVALNLFGVFEVTLGGGSTMTKANALASREGYLGAFFNGILATALATPCTAPFLASGMGAALSQSSSVIIAAMGAVAVGLAFPYVLLSFKPGWLKFLPKPGNWMVQFKQIMGFPMLAAAVWVLSFTGPMFGDSGVMWLGVLLVFVSLTAWVFGEFMQRTVSKSSKPLLACGLLLAAGYAMALEWGLDWRHPENRTIVGGGIEVKADGVQWRKWSPEAVAEARAAGQPVLVDFTADWCMTCKYTKGRAIEVDSVIKKLVELNGVAFIADWTNRDQTITKVLHQYKRAGVPLVLVYPPEGEAIVLPPVMNGPEKVLEALDKAGNVSP